MEYKKMEYLEFQFIPKSKNGIFGIPIYSEIKKWNIWNSNLFQNLKMEYLGFQFIPKSKNGIFGIPSFPNI